MKRVLILLSLYCASVACSAKPKITFAITNNASITLNVSIIVTDKNNRQVNVFQLGQWSPKESRNTQTFEISKNNTADVRAEVPNSFTASDVYFTITKSDTEKVRLIDPQVRLFNPDSQGKNIVNALYKLSDIDFGFTPMNVNGALNAYMGCLLVVRPPSKVGESGKILYYLPPSKFSSIEPAEKFVYNTTSDAKKIEVSKNTAVSVSAEFPMVVKFMDASTVKDYSSYSWNIQGFGWVNKIEEPDFDYTTAYNKLPGDIKASIQEALKQNPNSFLYYINKMYAISQMSYQLVSAKSITTKGNITVSTFATVDGLYDFSVNNSADTKISNQAIDIDGIPLFISQAQIASNTSAKATNNSSHVSIDQQDFTKRINLNNFNLKISSKDSNATDMKKSNTFYVVSPYDLKGYLIKENISNLKVLLKQQESSEAFQ